MIRQEVTDGIIGCALQVHRQLGPGLLESAYEECLAYEMTKASIFLNARSQPMPIIHDEL